MSRQTEYQARHLAAGLCLNCSRRAVAGMILCPTCTQKRRQRQRLTGQFQPWKAGGPGRPATRLRA